MGIINEIFRTFGPQYRRRFGAAMPAEHHKVIDAMIACRTERYGSALYHCESCGRLHLLPRGCGNRHCPGCQNDKSRQWLTRQLERQLPGHHFLITFTVPEPLRAFLRAHQRIGYGALFAASSEAMKVLALDPRFLGAAQPGFFGVLHTWGRQLQYHPHIHYVVPGGAIEETSGAWRASPVSFYLPVPALSVIVRAKFRDRMAKAGLLGKIAPEVWRQPWVVNSQAIGSAEGALKYLAPYVFRVAIADSRIVKVENGHVTFRYRKTGSNRPRILTLDAMEFIRRFLQHVLPTGFMKVRHYGFLSPSSAVSLQDVRARIELAHGFTVTTPPPEIEPPRSLLCRDCGEQLIYRSSILPHRRTVTWRPSG